MRGMQRRHHLLLGLLGLAAVGLVMGCGGGDDATDLVASVDTVAASDALVDRWGDEGAFIVVMTAYDRGYTAEQVARGALHDTLGVDGRLTGVEPAREPAGLLSDGPDGGSDERPDGGSDEGAAPAPLQVGPKVVAVGAERTDDDLPGEPTGADTPQDRYVADVDQWLSELYGAAESKLADLRAEEEAAAEAEAAERAATNLEIWVAEMTVALGMQGYSAEQIIEAIVLGDLAGVLQADWPCSIAVAASGGGYLQPEFAPSDALGCEAAGDAVGREQAEEAQRREQSERHQSGGGTPIPSGTYVGEFTGEISDFVLTSKPERVEGTTEPIHIEIDGDAWTLSTGWSVSMDVGSGCTSTTAAEVSGSGVLETNDTGSWVMGDAQLTTTNERWGATCPNLDVFLRSTDVSVFFDHDDGELTGYAGSYKATLVRN